MESYTVSFSHTSAVSTLGYEEKQATIAAIDPVTKAHSSNLHVCVSLVTPTGGYCLSGVVTGVETSLLLDTGAAVTLLRDDTWARITAKKPQEIRPWSMLKLVSAGGIPL